MTQRLPLVAANWKMNGSLQTIQPLLSAISAGIENGCNAEVAICPPFVYLPEVASKLQGTDIKLGAQNTSEHDSGAYTGEVSTAMLKDCSCQYVIVGHSERRVLYDESDELIAEKFIGVGNAGMSPILCVGERLEEREANITEEVIARQLDTVLDRSGIDSFQKAVIAYEPVWAIGTGKTASPEQAQEVQSFIRLRLARHDDAIADAIRIIYGGSVKSDNAEQLFQMADIDGGLIGGASLNADDFISICQATR
jgi:triosephosphate isomerase